jgi:SARP family transcriptional regulator, regulator of embCAB operon
VIMIRCYVHRLRSEFPIETMGPGYALNIDEISTDLDDFRDLVARGARSLRHEQPEIAQGYLGAAMSLWNGVPLSGVGDNAFVARQRRQLNDYRLIALELLVEARIAVQDDQSAIRDAQIVVREHPFRERMLEFLMVALHRTGRSKEALIAYFRLERRLIDEFGVNPCPRLRAVFESISEAHSSQLTT